MFTALAFPRTIILWLPLVNIANSLPVLAVNAAKSFKFASLLFTIIEES